jgi:hypothetical protein
MQAHMAAGAIAVPVRNPQCQKGLDDKHQASAALPPSSVAQQGGWASGPIWMGPENLAPTGSEPRTSQPIASRFTELYGFWAVHCDVPV